MLLTIAAVAAGAALVRAAIVMVLVNWLHDEVPQIPPIGYFAALIGVAIVDVLRASVTFDMEKR